MSEKRAVEEIANEVAEAVANEIMEEVVEEAEEVIEKPYTMRKIGNSDLWPVLKILSKILPDELKKAFVQLASGEKKLKEIGIMVAVDLGRMIIQNMYKAEDEVDKLCADLIGVSEEELNAMEFGTTPMIVMDFIEEAKKTTFFKVLSKFIF